MIRAKSQASMENMQEGLQFSFLCMLPREYGTSRHSLELHRSIDLISPRWVSKVVYFLGFYQVGPIGDG